MRPLYRYLLFALPMIAALCRTAAAQEVYIASWTVQDPDFGLQHELAVDVIERANEWLTRDNPAAPTARLDDRLRVTVVGEYDPADGTVRPRLQRINLGGMILDEGLQEFLDSAITARILLRAYYWRDEALTILDPSLSPQFYRQERRDVRAGAPPTYEAAFGNGAARRAMQSLNDFSFPVTDRARVWGGAGYEQLGFPGLSYRRLRAGVESGGVRGWFEVPLPFSAGAILSGENQAAPGVGLSFELGRFGGGVTWSDPYALSGMSGDTGYVMNTSALLYGIVPIDYITAVGGWLRLKLGAGYLQGSRMVIDSAGSAALAESNDYPRLFARGEFVSLRRDGAAEWGANLEIFGMSIVGSYYRRFGERFGVEVSGALHGIAGDPPPFFPGAALWISPVFFLK